MMRKTDGNKILSLFLCLLLVLTIYVPSLSVKADTLPIVGVVDAPAATASMKDTYKVRGWAIAQSGVAKVEILIDGKVHGTATYGLSRQDVYNAYPAYGNANAGFEYNLDTYSLTNGSHVLQVRITSKSGEQKIIQNMRRVAMENQPNVNVDNSFPILLEVDQPASGATVSGTVKVSGWALGIGSNGVDRRIQQIQIAVDGKVMGDATYGLPRSDVYRAYSSYMNENAGYEYMLDTASLAAGAHTLEVRAITKAGTVYTIAKSITVVASNMPFLIEVDTPSDNAVLTGKQTISGWTLAQSGIRSVEYLLDNTVLSTANGKTLLARPDVQRVFPQYNQVNVGFSYVLDTSQYSEGPHTLKIRVTSGDGGQKIVEKKVTIAKSLPLLFHVDTPTVNQSFTRKDDVVQIKGWALTGQGIDSIVAYLNTTRPEDSIDILYDTEEARPDVQRVFPQYNNGTAGFIMNIPVKRILSGANTIMVEVTSRSGEVKEQRIPISIQSSLRLELDGVTKLGPSDTPDYNVYRVSGWALADSGIKSITWLPDPEEDIGYEMTYGLARPDVYRVFPQYGDSNAGYELIYESPAPVDPNEDAEYVLIRIEANNGEVLELERLVAVPPLQ